MPVRFTARGPSQVASKSGASIPAGRDTPAQFTTRRPVRAPRGPRRGTASTRPASVTSQAQVRPPSGASRARPGRAPRRSRHRRRVSFSATARPIPEAAPVTTATRPATVRGPSAIGARPCTWYWRWGARSQVGEGGGEGGRRRGPACSGVTTRAGARRTAAGPHVSTRRPRRKQACSSASATSWSGSSMPIISRGPARRRSGRVVGLDHPQALHELVADPLAALSARPPSTRSRVARAAAQATALPPKVEPWRPAVQRNSSARPITADRGQAEARPCR